MSSKITRREFVQASAAAAAVAALVSCKPAATATPEPTAKPAATAKPTDKPTQAPPTATPKPRVLNMNMPLNNKDMGAQVDPGCSAQYASYFVNYLMFANLVMLDEKLQPVPDMAESWTISPDGITYTFKLRKGLKWADKDNTPITAKDFEYSIKRNLQPKLYCGGQAWQFVDVKGGNDYYSGKTTDDSTIGVKALDDQTLEIKLENPAAYFINVCTLPGFTALPKKSIDAGGENWTKPQFVMCSGPFKLVEWTTDQQMVFEANPNYHHGKVGVEKLVLRMIDQPATALAAYETGELDMCDLVVADVPRIKADAKLSKEYVVTPELSVQHLVITATIKPLDDIRVRHAIAMSIDKDKLCNVIQPGVGTPAYQFLAPGLLGYDGKIGTELKYNPAKAKELMKEAGYPDGKGFPTVYFSYGARQDYQTMFEAFQAMIKEAIGVTIVLAPGDQVSAGVKRDAKSPALGRQMWGADYPDPHNFMVVLYTCPPPASDAWKDPDTVWCDKKFDELVWKAAKELDSAKRAELYKQCEQQLVVDNPRVIPLYYIVRHRLIKPYVKNVILNGQGAQLLRKVSIEGKA